MYCTECGCKNSEDANFCVSCGAVLKQEETNQSVHKAAERSVKQRKHSGKRKGILAVIAAAALLAAVFVFWPRKVQYDAVMDYNSSGFAVGRVGEKYGVCNQERKEVIPAKYDAVVVGELYEKSGLVPVVLDEEMTFLNTKGKKVFDAVEPSGVEGYYVVRDGRKYGSVSRTGAYLLECSYRKIELEEKYEGRLRVKLDGKKTYMTVSGTVLFDSVEDENEYGFCAAKKDGKYGYIKSNGQEIIPAEYDSIRMEKVGDLGKLCVYMDEERNFIDENGSLIFDSVGAFGANGLAAVKSGDWCGYVNEDGEPLGGFYYTEVGDFGDHALARVRYEERWGYLNELGVMVISPQYDEASDFNESGHALVRYASEYNFISESGMEEYEYVEAFTHDTAIAKRDRVYGLVDRQGNLLTDVWYDLIYDEPAYQKAGVFRARKDGKFVLLGEDGKERSEFYDYIFHSVAEEHVGLLPYRSGDKWGMMDVQGEVVIEPILEEVWDFSSNGVWETIFEGKTRLINPEGNTIVERAYDEYEDTRYGGAKWICVEDNSRVYSLDGELFPSIEYDEVEVFSWEEKRYFVLYSNGTAALADENGEILTDFKYKDIDGYNGDEVIVSKGDFYGVEDLDGKEIIPHTYGELRFCEDDRWGYVWACDESGKWGSITREGEQVVPFEYDYIEEEQDGRLIVSVSGKYGILDQDLNWIVPLQYDAIWSADANGYYKVEIDSKEGIIDRNGNEILSVQYDWVDRNTEEKDEESYSEISIGTEEETIYGIINEDYEIIVPVEYEEFTFLRDRDENVCLFSATSFDGTKNLINTDGEILLSGKTWISPVGTGGRIVVDEPDRETTDIYDVYGSYKDTWTYEVVSVFQNGLALIWEDGLYGYVNTNGEQVIDCLYEEAKPFSEDGLAAVSDGNLWGYIDERGNMVTDFIFTEAQSVFDGTAQVVMENGESAVISVTGERLE